MMLRRNLLAALAMQLGQPDPKVLLDQSVTLDEENQRKLRSYVWSSEETRYINGAARRQEFFEINLVSGAMYWRRIGKLSEDEEQAEKQRLEKHLRLPGAGYNWREERRFLELLPSVHSAKIVGEEVLDGRRNYVIETKPLDGVRTPILSGQHYRLWVDRAELHWRKAEIRTVKKVSWMLHQLAVGRVSYPYSNGIVNDGDLKPGAVTTIELQRLDDGVWTLARHETRIGNSFRNELRYYDYRRFSSGSQLVLDKL